MAPVEALLQEPQPSWRGDSVVPEKGHPVPPRRRDSRVASGGGPAVGLPERAQREIVGGALRDEAGGVVGRSVVDHDDLERGRSLVRLSSALSVTVPAGWSAQDYGRRLDASVRLCGFTPLPLDGAHDAAFAAASIPLGTGLPNRRGRS